MAADPGYNEITIRVLGDDGPVLQTFDKVAAKGAEVSRKPVEIPVVASDPITDAWRARVNAEIKAAAKEALTIPVTADTEEFRGQVAETLASMRDLAREQIPLEATDADTFRASVLTAVAETRAEIGAILVPVEADTTRMATSEVPQLSGAGEAPQTGLTSLRPDYTPAPLFGGGEDPYAAAREAAQNEPPIELPVRAANPIDDAWLGQVRSSVRSIANDAVKIPVNPELEGFQAQLEETLAELAATERANIPVDVGDAMIFREQVQQLVAQVQASTKAVIDVQVNNEGALSDLQQKTVAASQASLGLVQAEQKLNQVSASGSEEAISKARNNVIAATEAEKDATQELRAAQAAAAEEAKGLAAAEDVASGSARGLGAAMGPLWMVMNALQIGMFALGSTSSTTSQQTQDVSQSIIQMGQDAGQSLASLVGGNQQLQQMGDILTKVGSSGAEFSRAFTSGLPAATAYTKQLGDEYSNLGNKMVSAGDVGVQAAQKLGLAGARGGDASMSIKDLATAVDQSNIAIGMLPQPVQDAVNKYNDFTDATGQTQNALKALKAEIQGDQQVLASLGYTIGDVNGAVEQGRSQMESYGLGIASAAKALSDAEAGSTYLEDSTDKASIAAGNGAKQWQQLQQAVTQAQQAYTQAAQGVANAEHGVETAQQGVASAIHSEQQAVIAVQTAQTAYTNSLYQEQQAQQAVTAARQAAEQQLISLQLQANDAAESVNSANLSLFNAQQNAGKYGVNANNAQQIAATTDITNANAAQVQAAQQLVAAENALADAQNSSSNAQSGLNTARAQGVDNNPQVLSAEHALEQAQQGVASAAQGVTNAQYAQQQSAQAVTNAEWSLQSASAAVGQAQTAEANAANALSTAQDNASRSTDNNTLAGAQNRNMLEGLFHAYQAETGNEQTAAAMTQAVGEKMDFTSQQIGDVIGSLTGLNGMSAQFFVTGTPSLNPQQLTQVGQELGLNFSQIESVLPGRGGHGAYAAGGATTGGMALVGEHGPELVRLAPGSQVIPAANTAGMLQGYASGGAVGALDNPMAALAANVPLVGQWAGLDAVGQALHAMGGPAVKLPPAGSVDLGPFGALNAGIGSGSGSMAASSAVAAAAQAYAASQLARHGWGPDQMPPLIKLWNQESGWNPFAVNPSSGAYGIPQALGHGHPYNLGDFVPQVDWGEDYVEGRYGSPAGAWAHERAYNWYAAGGPSGGGLAVVGEHGPEIVTSGGGGIGAPQAVQVELTVNFGGDTSSAMATAFMKMVREGKIQLLAGTQRVKVG
ncbi:MAG TPA: hypothetical protein VFQ42_04000 [Mycobacterium sp.]|nr:hypothetical protein [Mycobacterium sp.]